MHFGHDGAVSIIKDGKVVSYISRERISRVKHAIGITTNELDLALREAQISVNDIDYCTVVCDDYYSYFPLRSLASPPHIKSQPHTTRWYLFTVRRVKNQKMEGRRKTMENLGKPGKTKEN